MRFDGAKELAETIARKNPIVDHLLPANEVYDSSYELLHGRTSIIISFGLFVGFSPVGSEVELVWFEKRKPIEFPSGSVDERRPEARDPK